MQQVISDTDQEGFEELVLSIMRNEHVLSCRELAERIARAGGPLLEPDELELRLGGFLTTHCSCIHLDTYAGEYVYSPN